MIRSKGLDVCLLGFLVLSIGCVSPPKKTLVPGSPDDLPGCYAIFPREPWESVHRIEATVRGGGSSSLLGVTKGEPSERRLQSLLLTPEGFILFDAELSEGGIAVRKAVAPFDSPAFARGLMEDVSLLFLPPQVKPIAWGKETDGTMILPMIKINTWMGEGLLLLVPLSENLARIAGSGEIISLNDDTVNYIGLSFKKAREVAQH